MSQSEISNNISDKEAQLCGVAPLKSCVLLRYDEANLPLASHKGVLVCFVLS
jgi:hypothetical protein